MRFNDPEWVQRNKIPSENSVKSCLKRRAQINHLEAKSENRCTWGRRNHVRLPSEHATQKLIINKCRGVGEGGEVGGQSPDAWRSKRPSVPCARWSTRVPSRMPDSSRASLTTAWYKIIISHERRESFRSDNAVLFADSTTCVNQMWPSDRSMVICFYSTNSPDIQQGPFKF